ncbi:hypothetical protein NM208_g4156 [Fusarium decemcellulare]|uniref:Uncharacterized protein n=1 Tax=Fusarium decemcellulare TaxID=57161 RepID=A0ACC1SLU9_9HYPO|nr:hypothetical protein NM208_g4156 [Fusarium decemcellulare]
MATMQKEFTAYQARFEELKKSDNPYARGIAWVQGELVPLHEARIPLLDQGFLHSDLTYDVPAVWDGKIFRLDDHISRLDASCKKIRLQMPMSHEAMKQTLCDMLAKSGIRDAFIQLIVTRGIKGVRESEPHEQVNTLYMFIQPYVWVMEPEMQLTGGHAIVARTVRRTPPGSIDPTVKNHQWGDLTRAMHEARDRGAKYPFLTDGDTNLTEGSGFNMCFIKDGKLYTADRGVLEGITRKSVFDVARANNIEIRCETVPVAIAYEADEIFMCTTAGGVMPITTLDGAPVKDGKIGPITRTIWDGYWAMHYDPAYTIAVKYD